MGKRMNLVGKKFGRLLVIEFAEIKNHGSAFLCECDCGEKSVVMGYSLKNGTTLSCGCYRQERRSISFTTHGLRNEPLYQTWSGMVGRCQNINHMHYKDYGGRGIKICPEWSNGPKQFIEWAKLNNYRHGLTIERNDNDGDYCPENCRFVTLMEQAKNKRNNIRVSFNGEEKILADWTRTLGLPRNLLYDRYRVGDRGEYLFRIWKMAK